VVFGPSDLIEVDLAQGVADAVAALSNGKPATAKDIAKRLGISGHAVSHRLKKARERGLVRAAYGEHRGWVLVE